MTSLRIVVLLFLLSLLALSLVGAQERGQFGYSEEAATSFSRALDAYTGGNHAGALGEFEALIARSPVHQHTTASYLMAAKAAVALDEPERARDLLATMLKNYPSTRYAGDAHYTLGIAELKSEEYTGAAYHFVRAIEAGEEKKVVRRAEEMIGYLLKERLHPEMLTRLPQTTHGHYARDLLSLRMAENFYREREYAQARSLIDTVLSRRASGTINERARALHEKLSKGVSLKIGVLLPIGSSSSALADDILDGITFALGEKRTDFPEGMSIALDIHSSDRDSSAAKAALDELARTSETIAVIWPLYSSEAFACATRANELKLPLLSPTANAVGIAATGPYVFQLHPDLAFHGRAIARYAVQEKGLKTLALLIPEELAGEALVRNFIAEAESLGAAILATETYKRGADDLEAHFLNLREIASGGEPQIVFSKKLAAAESKKLQGAGVSKRRIDSLVRMQAKVNVTTLFGPRGRRIADSLHLKVVVPSSASAHDLAVPLTSIDGIFAPVINAEEIGPVGSQLTFYNIRSQLLGNGEWNDLPELEQHKRDVEGAIFCSDTYIDRNDGAVEKFGSAFGEKKKKSPSRYTLFGYDAMRLILDRLLAGATTREALAGSLARVTEYRGLHTAISLEGGRVNSILQILRFESGEITKVGEVKIR